MIEALGQSGISNADADAVTATAKGTLDDLLFGHFAQTFGDGDGLVERDAGQEQAELLAAQPSKHIAGANQAARRRGEGAQYLVSGSMSPGIVDFLEMIQIDQQ